MDEAKDYKAYLKALKEATKKKQTGTLGSTKDYIKRRKIIAGIEVMPKVGKFTDGGMCRGMGAAVKGGNFKGVK